VIRLIIATLFLVPGGCGLRGDLYLPTPPEPVPAGQPPALPPTQPEPSGSVEATGDVDSPSAPVQGPMATPESVPPGPDAPVQTPEDGDEAPSDQDRVP
jgi:hypothetical protein